MVGLLIYLYKIIQSIKSSIHTSHFLSKINIITIFEPLTSLITLIFSYFSSFHSNIFYLWVLFASISTIYSYLWDLKIDWGLLQTQSKNKYLRDILIY